jgi:hypothetical protein
LNHPLANSSNNAVWNGNSISIFGARNEIVAFQLIIQSDSSGTNNVSVTLDQLTNGSYTIKNTGSSDPFDYRGKHIELFTEHYTNITERTRASWLWSWDARAMDIHGNEYLGWIPDALIPFEAPSGLGGTPFDIASNNNQGVWIDIFIPKDAPPGTYTGNLRVETNLNTIRTISINLRIYGFTLPDENHFKNFFFAHHTSFQDKHGVSKGSSAYYDLVMKYNQMAHRHRLDLSFNGTLDFIKNHFQGYLTGDYYTGAYKYEGLGKGVGNGTYAIGVYDQPSGSQSGFTNSKDVWWQQSDAWVNWFEQNAPNTEIFKYMRDEPLGGGTSAIEDVKTKSEWLHTNPGPGKRLMSYCTTGGLEGALKSEFEGYVDFWSVTEKYGTNWNNGILGYSIHTANQYRNNGDKVALYNGTRPDFGTIVIDTDAIDFRSDLWIAWKYDVDQYFHWFANSYLDGSRSFNPFKESNRGTGNSLRVGMSHIFYPGEEKEYPQDDRELKGPISSIRMKNWRRGQQDYEYLWLAQQAGYFSQIQTATNKVIPEALSEISNHKAPSPWVTRGYEYEQQRKTLAELLNGGSVASPTPKPDIPGDGNGDGLVDGKDFIIWLTHYGQSVSGSSNGDFDNNNTVNISDHIVWVNNFIL